jgi:hypothetical protein
MAATNRSLCLLRQLRAIGAWQGVKVPDRIRQGPRQLMVQFGFNGLDLIAQMQTALQRQVEAAQP